MTDENSGRKFLRRGFLASLLGFFSIGVQSGVTRKARALSVNNLDIIGDSITTQNGNVENVRIGNFASQPDERVIYEWSGLESGTEHEFQITLEVRGSEEDEEGWDTAPAGPAQFEYSVIDETTETPEGRNGSVTEDWSDIFTGNDSITDPAGHPNINPEDFEAQNDGETRERVLEARITLFYEGGEGEPRDEITDNFTISVTNAD